MKTSVALALGTDAAALTRRAVETLVGMRRIVKPADRVLIKPNVCLPQPPENGMTTDPEVVRALAEMAFEAGAERVLIGESPIIGFDCMEAFEVSGIAEAARRTGAELLDLNTTRTRTLEVARPLGVESVNVFTEALDCNVLINAAKMKLHGAAGITAAMKNLKGCIDDATKKRMHIANLVRSAPGRPMGLNYSVCDLYGVLRPALNVVDAVDYVAGASPGFVAASPDAAAVDALSAHALGIDPEGIPMLRFVAENDLGCAGLEDIMVLGDAPEGVEARLELSEDSGVLELPEENLDAAVGHACSGCVSQVPSNLNRIQAVEGVAREGLGRLFFVLGKGPELPAKIEGKLVLFGNCARETGAQGLEVPGCPPAGACLLELYREGKL